MRPHHSEEKTEMQAPDRPDRPERPEWLDAWEAIDVDAVTALAYALHGYGVDAIAARDALHALSGEWELGRVGSGGASPVEGSGGHEPFQSTLARTIWETSRRDEGTISATGANIIAAALAPLVEARVREALLEAKAAEDARVDEVMRRMGRDHLQQIMARDGHSKGSPEWHRHDQGRWAFRQSAAIVDREHGFKRDVYGSWSEEWSPR